MWLQQRVRGEFECQANSSTPWELKVLTKLLFLCNLFWLTKWFIQKKLGKKTNYRGNYPSYKDKQHFSLCICWNTNTNIHTWNQNKCTGSQLTLLHIPQERLSHIFSSIMITVKLILYQNLFSKGSTTENFCSYTSYPYRNLLRIFITFLEYLCWLCWKKKNMGSQDAHN